MGSQVEAEWIQGLPTAWRQRLESILPVVPAPHIIICYGSRWAGLPLPNSDYDVLMIGESTLSPGESAAVRRTIRRVAPDVDWRWLSLRGARANRLINPTLSWAMRTGKVLGHVDLLGEPVPVPVTSLRAAAEDILDDLEGLGRLDDPWAEEGKAYRQLAKRLVVLEQLLEDRPDARALSHEVTRIMEGGHPEQTIARRAERVIARTQALPLNAGDALLRRVVHE
ncbi:MAG: hypothetical protein K6U87_05580 [Firmicutes bacterium]|nr:hypothetical protein [Bacillota bacterium]